jgi:NADH:ubiquinone oxidoreductase subunit 6 (subunit J)
LISPTTWHAAEAIVPGPAITMIGEQLITKYLVPFEVAGVPFT